MNTLSGAEQAVRVAEKVQGWMRRSELLWLYKMARTLASGAVWLEVGTWKGKSYFATALGMPLGTKIIGVDTFEGTANKLETACKEATLPGDRIFKAFQNQRDRILELRPDVELTWIREDSVKAAEQVEDQSLDVCFIDGDHRFEPFIADLRAWSPKLKLGGILCGHDYTNPEIRLGLTEMKIQVERGAGSIWVAL